MDDKVKARAFDKIIAHLTRAVKIETRKREQRRAQIALKHIKRFIEESQRELDNELLFQRSGKPPQAVRRTGVVG